MGWPLQVTSDVLLALLFPCTILLIGYRLYPSFSWAEIREILSPNSSRVTNSTYFSLQRAYHTYAQFSKVSVNELSQMRRSYESMGYTHKRMGRKIGYPDKLDRLQMVNDLNATLAEGIADLALEDFETLADSSGISPSSSDLGRARESFKHFVRDWSEEGVQERAKIFAPILELLSSVPSEDRMQNKVLVPGCGLGRLAWEIHELGFDTTANELSFFMTLPLRFLLSPKTTVSQNQHTLRPYSHWFSHQRSNESLFRAVTFPDVVPRLGPNFRLIETDFLTLPVPSGAKEQNPMFWSKSDNRSTKRATGYDYIVTLFFIDTAINVFATMEHIYHLLRPGGVWVNLGPLLWTGGGQAKVELSLEELLHAADEIGFIVQDDGLAQQRTVEYWFTKFPATQTNARIFRVRFEAEEFYDDEPAPPTITEGMKMLREAKRAPFNVVCSIAEQGLGPVAWWNNAQLVEGDVGDLMDDDTSPEK